MVQEVSRRKALAAVLEKAVVTDTAGTTIDLNELVPQAEVVEPELEEDADEADLEELSDETDEADTEAPAKA
jgi:trigger factor